MNTMAILLSDTYKQIHNKIYPKGLTKLVSYWTPRRSMLKNQNKMVLFGLQAFIEEYFELKKTDQGQSRRLRFVPETSLARTG